MAQNPIPKPPVTVSASMKADLYEELCEISYRVGATRSQIINRAVTEFIERFKKNSNNLC